MEGRRLLTLILAVLAVSVYADTVGPAYVDSGTPSGSCSGTRVQFSSTGTQYCCISSTWTACGSGGGGSPGGLNTYVQFNDSGAFGGSSTLTWDKTNATLTFGAANTYDAIKFTNTGARLHLGSLANAYLYQDSGGFVATPNSFKALNYQSSAVGQAAITLFQGQGIAFMDNGAHTTNSGIGQTGGSAQNLDITANASQTPAGVINLNSNTKLGANTITSTAPTGFVGNASTASALAASPTTCGAGIAATGVDTSGNALGCFTPGGGGGADALGTYLVQTATHAPVNAQVMGSLGTGLELNTTTTGVQSIYGGADAGAGNAIRALNASGGVQTSIAVPTISGSSVLKGSSGNAVAATAGTDYSAGTSALSTGILKSTTSTGALSIASAGTDYSAGTSANATGLVLSTTSTGALTAYGGTSCTNQFPRSLNASGAATCASVALGSDVTGSLPVASVNFSGTQYGIPYYTAAGTIGTTAAPGSANVVAHGAVAGAPTWSAVDLSADTASTVLPMTKGGTGANLTGTVGALLAPTSTTVVGQIADVAVGSALVSGGVGVAPSYSASATCTSSGATTCTITGRRSGCLPVCSMTTSVSTTFHAAISSTTITCTFGTSGTNTCNCICF
ncbi:MAG TPA: hypothetical protein VMT56_00335 [Candidatus Bathyarchaeia archaeon]|nr:hypothetical protein [Candidatus Bathyarchaeia archaeon]